MRISTIFLNLAFPPPYNDWQSGAWVLRRMDGDTAHFLTLSFWESRDAIVAFAGADIEVAKYYAEDEK